MALCCRVTEFPLKMYMCLYFLEVLHQSPRSAALLFCSSFKSNFNRAKVKFSTPTHYIQNHRIIQFGRHLWRSPSPASCSEQIPLDQVAQGPVPSRSENLQGWKATTSLDNLQVLQHLLGNCFLLLYMLQAVTVLILVLLSFISEKSLGLPSLQPTSRDRKTVVFLSQPPEESWLPQPLVHRASDQPNRPSMDLLYFTPEAGPWHGSKADPLSKVPL